MQYYYESKPDTQNYHYINHKTRPFVALHFHSAIELLMVRRGRMLAVINGEELFIEAGQGCFVNSFCLHSYREAEEHTEVYSFVGNSAFFETVFSDLGGVPPTRFCFEDFPLLDKMIQDYREADRESLRSLVFRGAVALILASVAKSNPLLPDARAERSDEICAVLRYISEHCAEDLTLRSLAATFGYSPPYFSRLFHRYMKVNLTDYINIARVNRAKKMLDKKGSQTVAEIAFACGFSSMPSFYRTYKKTFGNHPKG